MSNRFDLLTQQLFQKDFSECSEAELQSVAHQFPFFAPVQFALTKKLQASSNNEYQQQLQKAVLYYHDPVSFMPFLDSEENIPELLDDEQEEQVQPQETVPEPAQPVEEIQVEEETSAEETEGATEEEFTVAEEATEPDSGPEPVLNEIKISLPSTTAPAQEDTSLAFEPYHTIDYFASQGIKLSQDEATKDKFGKQLKSFTEWLKTMKKIPPVEQSKPADVVSEQKVESMAAHSVETAEVVTEAMADVWIKQGNLEKAIDIYNKLSLQNPSKRAYFAAKLDSLKKEI